MTFLKLTVKGPRVITDAHEGRAAREKYLEGQPVNGRPVLIDLRAVQAMNATAIDELLVGWLGPTRRARGGVVVCLWVTSHDVLRTIDLVLKSSKQASYAWTRDADPETRVFHREQPAVFGDVTTTNFETLNKVIESGGAITAKDLTAPSAPASTATNRLTELASKGLLMRSSQAGRAGDLFIYPFCPKGRAEIADRIHDNGNRRILTAV